MNTLGNNATWRAMYEMVFEIPSDFAEPTVHGQEFVDWWFALDEREKTIAERRFGYSFSEFVKRRWPRLSKAAAERRSAEPPRAPASPELSARFE